MELLAGFPDEIVRTLSAVRGEEALFRPGSDGGWGVVEILPHLRDWEIIFLERMQRIVAEDRPYLEGYDDALWPIERDYRGQNPAEVLAEFAELRGDSSALLGATPAEGWVRPAEHGIFGDITLHWLANYICTHDETYQQQIRDAVDAS